MSDPFPVSPFARSKGHCPFTGIATFAGTPLWKAGMRADAVVLGVPYDEGTSYRPGTRFGPRAVRDASMFYSYEDQCDRFFDADRRKWILAGKIIADAGDVNIRPLSLEKNQQAIMAAVRTILDKGSLPVVIGGDHSISHPVVKAFEGRELHYIHLDSHLDCDRIFDSAQTHGSPVARILEDGLARSITLIGIRGLTNSGHDFAWIESKGATILTAREVKACPAGSRFGQLLAGDYYVSVDIDVFDPSAAPGTGTPEPGGLFFPEFSDLLHEIAGRGRIIGCDLTEVNPLLDNHAAGTAHLAARCIIELISAALDKQE